MRIFFGIILFLAAMTVPFPVTLLLMLFGLVYFPYHFESVGVALLIEFLYRGGGRDMFGGHFPLGALVLVALCIIEVLRMFIRERRA